LEHIANEIFICDVGVPVAAEPSGNGLQLLSRGGSWSSRTGRTNSQVAQNSKTGNHERLAWARGKETGPAHGVGLCIRPARHRSDAGGACRSNVQRLGPFVDELCVIRAFFGWNGHSGRADGNKAKEPIVERIKTQSGLKLIYVRGNTGAPECAITQHISSIQDIGNGSGGGQEQPSFAN